MARFKFLAVVGSFSLVIACSSEKEPDEGGGGGDAPAAKILSFEATPATLPPHGGTLVLSWETENATGAQLRANGEVVVESLWPPSSGELSRLVTEPTTFELVAFGAGGDESRELRVELADDVPTIISFTASPSEIHRGETTILRWKTDNADSVEIRDEKGESLDLLGAVAQEGAVGVRPLKPAEYTLIATRNEVQVEARAQVTVIPVQLKIVSFGQAEPKARLPGDDVVVEWVVEGADSITVSNLEGEELEVGEHQLALGSATLTMGEQGRFRLVARQEETTVEEEFQVPILTPPSIGEFLAVPPAVTEPSGITELRWERVERAESLVLERSPGEAVDLSGHGLEEGSVEVEVDATTRFVLVATNAAGEDRAEVDVALVPLPTLHFFTATPARVGEGEAFTLSWASENAIMITIEDENGPLDNVSDSMLSHSVTRQIFEDTEYVLRLYNAAGNYVEGRLLVTVGAPQILAAGFEPPFVAPGQSAQLEWKILGGTELQVIGAEGCETLDPEAIAEGSCLITAPEEAGSHEYLLRVENGKGDQSEALVTLITGEGPFVRSFVAEPSRIEEGGAVEFQWLVIGDPAGASTELSLSDGTEDYDISDRDPLADSKSFVLDTPGSYEFILTATSANGSRFKSTVVEVVGLPSVELSSSAAVYEGTAPVTLSWTTMYSEGALVLYEVAEGGQLLEIYEVPEDERASGSFEVEPTKDSTYRLVADNGFGSTASDELSLSIGPPVILSLEADPQEIILGEELELSWTTRLADRVTLNIPHQPVELFNDPFVDISSTGTPLLFKNDCGWEFNPFSGQWEYPHPLNDEGCGTLTLPAGFEFPLGGESFQTMRIFANGGIGFDLDFNEITYWNEPFPTTWPVHIAPMWNDQVGVQVWYEMGADSEGHYLLVQWKSELFGAASSLEYQALLREDGSFVFRYGNMAGDDDDAQAMADGSSATIGYQSVDGSEWSMLHFGGNGPTLGPAVQGGLSKRSWAFPASFGPNDSLTIRPLESQTLILTAHGPKGEVSEVIEIVVHPGPELVVVEPVEEPQADWPFELGWRTANAESVEILDADGEVICSSAPGEEEEGSCFITEATAGTYDYTIRAYGALGSEVEEEVSIEVFPTFVLESFQVDVEVVEPKGSVTLSWVTHGAADISLTANGEDILPPGADPSEGEALHSPTEHTFYVLTITSADNRTRWAVVEVVVKTVDFTLSADATSITQGESVTLSWSSTALTGGTPTVYLPMVETLEPFDDISSDPDAVELIGPGQDGASAVLSFEGGFTFPFGGEVHEEVKVFTDGFLSFDMNAAANNANEPFTVPGKKQVHIAPFWDNLHTRIDGRVYALEDEGSYIIQWSGVSRFSGSSNSNQYDLNFQVILHSDGSFDFVYGAMSAPPNASNASCTDGDCALDAQGASATIGYQNPSAAVGYNIHPGIGAPFSGGLSNRAFRMKGGASGELTLYPPESTTYEVCSELETYLVCEEVEVEVLAP